MSSELYVRWEVQNLENLRRQLLQQLAAEKQHQAEIFKQVMEDISFISAQISTAKNSAESGLPTQQVRITKISNVSDFDTEDISSSSFDATFISQLPTTLRGNDSKKDLVAIDWSAQLVSFEAEPSDAIKKATYAQSIGAQLSAAIILKKEDIDAKNNFVIYLNKLLHDSELSFEYFKSLIERRFSQLKSTIEILHLESDKDNLFEYYALCQLLNINPEGIDRAKLKVSIKELTEKLSQRKIEDFVYQNLKEVFAELNLAITDEVDSVLGRKIIDNSISDCAIYMSADSGGIIFETVGEVESSGSISSNQKALIEESARRICTKHLEVIKRMRERGILLHIDCETTPNAEKIKILKSKTVYKKVGQGGAMKYIGE